MTEPMSLMSHVSIGVDDLARATEFYDAVLGTIGATRIMEHDGTAVAYGREFPEFWVQRPLDGQKAGNANGIHFAFLVEGPDQVRAFYDAALQAGATGDGKPGPRPEYGAAYYGCFLRDPDGYKIEAMSWDAEKAEEGA